MGKRKEEAWKTKRGRIETAGDYKSEDEKRGNGGPSVDFLGSVSFPESVSL